MSFWEVGTSLLPILASFMAINWLPAPCQTPGKMALSSFDRSANSALLEPRASHRPNGFAHGSPKWRSNDFIKQHASSLAN